MHKRGCYSHRTYLLGYQQTNTIKQLQRVIRNENNKTGQCGKRRRRKKKKREEEEGEGEEEDVEEKRKNGGEANRKPKARGRIL